MKVIWLGHLSNQELKIGLNNQAVKEFAPWMTIMLRIFTPIDALKLYMVAPNVFNNLTTHFVINDVEYILYQYMPNSFYKFKYLRKLYNYFFVIQYFYLQVLRLRIGRIVRDIQPDIVHLHGTENPYYSNSFLSLLTKYKTVVSIQGFINTASDSKNLKTFYRKHLENKIIRKSQNFFIRATFMKSYISELNPDAKLFWAQYPYAKPLVMTNREIDMDIVFFGRVSKLKGVEDLISALGVLKSLYGRNVTCRIIGSITSSYHRRLVRMAQNACILENIEFKDFVKTQNELHALVQKSRICVFPTHDDIYSGTIVECMYMKIPVITYSIPGLFDLTNAVDQTIVVVPFRNIDALAEAIYSLLNNQYLQIELAYNAQKFANEFFSETAIVNNTMIAYQAITN
jgi:glycosyltransferase involved in cell wall biosynthesis